MKVIGLTIEATVVVSPVLLNYTIKMSLPADP